jgi:hypothetical protein
VNGVEPGPSGCEASVLPETTILSYIEIMTFYMCKVLLFSACSMLVVNACNVLQFDAEIVFWEGKTLEQQHQVEFLAQEAARIEVAARLGEEQVCLSL